MNLAYSSDRQVTHGASGKILTNVGAWSSDGRWLVYDVRSDPAGDVFDGNSIRIVNAETGEDREVYQSTHGAHCGAATFNPRKPQVIFIAGPENPTADWQYGPWHRRGVIVSLDADYRPTGAVRPLDARDLIAPYTPGALRGGTHLHVWDDSGGWVAFTYEDHVLAQAGSHGPGDDINQRNVGVSVPGHPVAVSRGHVRNHDGDYFSVLVTRTTARPTPGSDEISRASEEAWVGTNGYVGVDGRVVRRALAFQGKVTASSGATNSEVFIVDLPEDLTRAGEDAIQGTSTRLPKPPARVVQRRLTHTESRKYPGLQGPRHWLRSSPDGARIAFLMKDDAGVVQLWTVSPHGGAVRQLTRGEFSIGSSFTWSPDGRQLAHVMDNSVCVSDAESGTTVRLTARSSDERAPRPEACVFSPDGTRIAYIRRIPTDTVACNQVFVVDVK